MGSALARRTRTNPSLAVGTFLFVRPIKLLSPENIYTLCHPPQAARLDFIMRTAVSWCRQNRPALADWMSPKVFDKIMSTLAYVEPVPRKNTAIKQGLRRIYST